MLTKKTTRRNMLRNAGILMALFALPLLMSSFGPGNGIASADPPNTVLATVKYCKSKMGNNLDKSCTESNMNKLRAAFKDDCKSKDACIENKAEDGIDQIKKKNPKNASDFNDALNSVINGAGGGGGGGGAGGGGGGGTPGRSNSIRTAGNQSGITAGGLPRTNASSGTLKRILQFFFGLIGAFAVLNITLSGLKYITSSGNEQKAAEAKNGIVYSLLGLAIAISAEALIAFVVTQVSK